MNPYIYIGAAAVFLLVTMVVLSSRRNKPVGPARARELLRMGALVVDIRSSEDFAAGHARGSVNVPFDGLLENIDTVAFDKYRPLLVHCHDGKQSEVAVRMLRKHGHMKVHNLGGYEGAWRIVGLADA